MKSTWRGQVMAWRHSQLSREISSLSHEITDNRQQHQGNSWPQENRFIWFRHLASHSRTLPQSVTTLTLRKRSAAYRSNRRFEVSEGFVDVLWRSSLGMRSPDPSSPVDCVNDGSGRENMLNYRGQGSNRTVMPRRINWYPLRAAE
jgi:hypothetical protein